MLTSLLPWLFRRSVSDHKTKLLSRIAEEPPQECCRDRSAGGAGFLSNPSPPGALPSSSRVRLHDLRSDRITLSLAAHRLGVSAVQMDDWKIVSGGEEGLVCVWDYRMNQKLWEVHSR